MSRRTNLNKRWSITMVWCRLSGIQNYHKLSTINVFYRYAPNFVRRRSKIRKRIIQLSHSDSKILLRLRATLDSGIALTIFHGLHYWTKWVPIFCYLEYFAYLCNSSSCLNISEPRNSSSSSLRFPSTIVIITIRV